MHKKMKKTLIIVICIIAALFFIHLTMNYLIPVINEMHNGMI